jgi:hypothetical protein
MNDLANRIKAAYRLPVKQPAPAPKPPPKPEAPAKAKQEPAPIKLKGNMLVRRACGHEEPLGAIMSRACPACKKARRLARRPKKIEKGRLPDGAVLQAHYHAETETWSGSLTVNGQTWEGTGPALLKLLTHLDNLYRTTAYQQQEQDFATHSIKTE